MTYVPLVGVITLVALLFAWMRRPLRTALPVPGLGRARWLLSVLTLAFAVWGAVQTIQSGANDLERWRLLDSGARAEATVYEPTGFLDFEEAVTTDGPCDRVAVRFDHRGTTRRGHVVVAGHTMSEGDRVTVAFEEGAPSPGDDDDPMVAVHDPCVRPIRSGSTGIALLLISGVCLVLRRAAAPRNAQITT